MIVKVKVVPNSDKFRILLIKEGDSFYLRANVKNLPKKDKANKELLKGLKKLFGSVEIVSGLRSREKYINVDANIKQLEKILESRKSE